MGAGVGGALGVKATSPAFMSQFIFNIIEKEGLKIPGRKALGGILDSPMFQQAIYRTLKQKFEDMDKE